MSDPQRYAVAGLLGAAAMVLVLVGLLDGCGFQAGLAKTHEGLKVMSQEVEPRLADECMRRARQCRSSGIARPGDCNPLLRCRAWKRSYAAGVQMTHRGLVMCNDLYIEIRKAGVLK